MKICLKEIIPNKSWIIHEDGKKLGTLLKNNKNYTLLQKGKTVDISKISDIYKDFDVVSLDSSSRENKSKDYSIYNYPCKIRPFNPTFDLKKKLPLFSKSLKSKSLYCAGYYIIKFQQKWTLSFCPKFITLERYLFKGPFKTETQARQELAITNQNETFKYTTN